jgi:putative transcriptional regulator
MWGRVTLFGALGLALSFATLFAANHNSRKARFSGDQQLATGDILIANERLADPNFARSVLLMLQFDPDEGSMGVILNRRTKIAISEVFPKAQHATKDPVYLGGPVQISAIQALLRLSEKAAQARHVIGDVFVSGAKELIEKSISSQTDPSKFRVYLGYAGWAPGQLEAEAHIGVWSIIGGGAQIAFDRDPDSLWQRLTRESQMQIASTLLPVHYGITP